MADDDERRLIERAQSGDAPACAALVRAHYASVYRMLVHLTRGDAHAAEDLCQETFATAWTRLNTFASGSSLATWLHRIAYRRFLDARRSAQSRSRTWNAFAEHANVADDRNAPLANVVAGDETRTLYVALEQLDDVDRRVLTLHYLAGLSYQKVAEITDEPTGTVKWRTKIALARLRSILAETNDELDRRQATSPAAAQRAPAAGAPARSAGRRLWRIAIAGVGAAALAAGVMIGIVILRHSPSDIGPTSVSRRDVEPAFMQHASIGQKETRPCDILPPLPQSL